MSKFYFSHRVFKRLVLQTHKNQGLFAKALNNFACYKMNVAEMMKFVLDRKKATVGISKVQLTIIFSFSHNVFKSPLFHGC